MDIIDSLGHTIISQNQDMLFEFAQQLAQEVAAWGSTLTSEGAEKKQGPSKIQRYIELVLSTRRKIIDEDLDLDQRLVTAASNAISILNYASCCELIDFQLSDVRNFSYCRIPYANFNYTALTGCNFEHADLNEASFFRAYLRGASFRHANLGNATAYGVEIPDPNVVWRPARVSRDEKWFAVVSHLDKTCSIQIRDAQSLNLIRELERVPSQMMQHFDICLSDDSEYLAVSSQSLMVTVWEVATGDARFRLGPHEHAVYSVAFHPSGKFVATGTVRGTVHLWDLDSAENAECKWKAAMPSGYIRDPMIVKLAFSPDGTLLVEVLKSGEVRIRNIESQEIISSFRLGIRFPPADFCSAAFSADGCIVAIQSGVSIELRDLRNPERPIFEKLFKGSSELFTPTGLTDDQKVSGVDEDSLPTRFAQLGLNFWQFILLVDEFVAFFEDGRLGVTANGSIRPFTAASWRSNLNLHRKHKPRLTTLGHLDAVPVSVSPDGSCIIVIGTNLFNRSAPWPAKPKPLSTQLLLADYLTMTCFGEVTCPDRIYQATWTSDSASVLLVADFIIHVLDTSSCQIVQVIENINRLGNIIERLAAFPRDEMRFLPDDKLLRTDVDLLEAPCPVAFKSDSKLVALLQADFSIGIVRLGDTLSPLVRSIPLPETDPIVPMLKNDVIQLSDDDRYLAVLRGYGEICIFDLATDSNEPIIRDVPTEQHEPCRGFHQKIAFSPDSRLVAFLLSRQTIAIWDLSARTMKKTLTDAEVGLESVYWSAEGRLLITCLRKHTRFWDIETGSCIGRLSHVGCPRGVAWSPDMRELITLDAGESVLTRWKLELRRRKVPLFPEDERNWRFRAKAQQTKLFSIDSNVMEADYAHADLSPALISSIERSWEGSWAPNVSTPYDALLRANGAKVEATPNPERLRKLAELFQDDDKDDNEFVEL